MVKAATTIKTASRLAWRNLNRTKLQSILVIALTVIPFAVASYISTASQSSQATTSEQIDYQLGRAKNLIQPQVSPGADWYQNPTYIELTYSPPTTAGTNPVQAKDTGVLTDPLTVLPSKDVVVLRNFETTWETKNGIGSILGVQGEVWSPKFGSDKFAKVLSGVTPKANSEVMLSPTAMSRFGVKLGDQITRYVPDNCMQCMVTTHKYKVVGILKTAKFPNLDVVYAPELIAADGKIHGQTEFYYFDGKPLSWKRTIELNKLGLGVLSREVLANPPALIDQPLITINQPGLTNEELSNHYGYGGFWRWGLIIAWAYSGLMILIPIAVIVSAAFSFGARRQTHALAMLSSVGATKRTIRAVTMVSALLLTMIGAIIGISLGISLAALILPQTARGDWHLFAGLHIDWMWMIAFAIFAVILAFMVGFVPARQSTKMNVLSVLRGTNLPQRLRVRTGVFSLIMLGGSSIYMVAVSAWHKLVFANQISVHQGVTEWLTVTSMFAQITLMLGFVIGSGWVIRGVSALLLALSKLFKSFELRFAARDLLLSRRRFSPLVSAMAIVGFIATAAITSLHASAITSAAMSQSLTLSNQVFVDANQQVTQYTKSAGSMSYGIDGTVRSPGQVEGLRRELVASSSIIKKSAILGKTVDPWSTSAQEDKAPIAMAHLSDKDYCSSISYVIAEGSSGGWQDASQKMRACENDAAEATKFVIGDVEGLRLMSGGAVNTEAERVLAAGGFVAFDSIYAQHNTVNIDWVKRSELYAVGSDGKYVTPAAISSFKLESVMNPSIHGHSFAFTGMMSPETADKLGIVYSNSLIVLNTSQRIPSELADKWMQAGIAPIYDQTNSLTPEEVVFWGNLILLGLVLLISGLAIGLTQLEARNDQRTLSRLGASRKFIGATTAIQLLLLLMAASGLGALGGELVSRTVFRGIGSYVGQSPWEFYLLLIVVAPLTASLIAYLATPKNPERKAKVAIE